MRVVVLFLRRLEDDLSCPPPRADCEACPVTSAPYLFTNSNFLSISLRVVSSSLCRSKACAFGFLSRPSPMTPPPFTIPAFSTARRFLLLPPESRPDYYDCFLPPNFVGLAPGILSKFEELFLLFSFRIGALSSYYLLIKSLYISLNLASSLISSFSWSIGFRI